VPSYGDPAQLLCEWLAAFDWAGHGFEQPAAQRWLTEVPLDLQTATSMPCVVIERYGGADQYVGLDEPRLDIHLYAIAADPMQARSAALARSEDIRRVLRTRLVGRRLGPVGAPFVSRLATVSGPTIRPYDSLHRIRRAHASYALTLHQPI